MLSEAIKDLQQRKNKAQSSIESLKKEISKLDDAIKALSRISGGAVVQAQPAKKRKMSAAGRKAIAAAQKARWAKVKAAKKK